LLLAPRDIGEASTVEDVTPAAMSWFDSTDVVVNKAGVFFTKRFMDYTAQDFRRAPGGRRLGGVRTVRIHGAAKAQALVFE